MTKAADPIQYILSQPLVTKPGSKWNYNGGAVQLLAYIIEKATGIPMDGYADKHLFTPLGIKSFFWHKFPGAKEPEAASGLRLRSRDALNLRSCTNKTGTGKLSSFSKQHGFSNPFLNRLQFHPIGVMAFSSGNCIRPLL
jgi:CubicO group peptidase (beta-lactamase class C family)